MDSSHISLCALNLKSTGFQDYRCDRDVALGLSLTNLAKILKCASNDDSITMRAADNADVATFIFENKDKISEFEFKLMDIDSENLNVPDKKFDCHVKMPSKEFRTVILGNLLLLPSVHHKDFVKFSAFPKQQNIFKCFKKLN